MSYVGSACLVTSSSLVDSQRESLALPAPTVHLLISTLIALQPQNSIASDLIPTSMQVVKFCGHRVIVKDNHRSLNWADLIVTMNENPPPGLNLEDEDQNIFNQEKVDISSMVKRIVDWLHTKYNVLPDVNQLREEVLTTFTDLEVANRSGWADFYKSHSGTNSSYEYRVVFGTPHPHTTESFSAVVITILMKADTESESFWWGLEKSTIQNFGAIVTTMKIHVEKGFKDPGSSV